MNRKSASQRRPDLNNQKQAFPETSAPFKHQYDIAAKRVGHILIPLNVPPRMILDLDAIHRQKTLLSLHQSYLEQQPSRRDESRSILRSHPVSYMRDAEY